MPKLTLTSNRTTKTPKLPKSATRQMAADQAFCLSNQEVEATEYNARIFSHRALLLQQIREAAPRLSFEKLAAAANEKGNIELTRIKAALDILAPFAA